MADRQLYQDGADFHPATVDINLQFTATTAGAVPATTAAGWRRAGIASVVLSGTGLYTVTFQDKWYSILGYTAGVYQVTYDKTHAGAFISTPATTLSSSVALQAISTDGNGTSVALTSGDIMWAIFKMARIQGNG